jgi:hypothetical protein
MYTHQTWKSTAIPQLFVWRKGLGLYTRMRLISVKSKIFVAAVGNLMT